MKNNWKKAAALLGLGALLLGLTGCAQKKEPIELTVWTYYNGEQLGAFNEAVEAFNATEGKNNNITVSASSLGSVNDLEQNVMDALQGKVGAQKVPDIFSAYADTAYAVDNMGRAADLSPYLTDKDKKEYYCIRCQYVGPEEDVLAKNELIRIKYGRMYDRITFDD